MAHQAIVLTLLHTIQEQTVYLVVLAPSLVMVYVLSAPQASTQLVHQTRFVHPAPLDTRPLALWQQIITRLRHAWPAQVVCMGLMGFVLSVRRECTPPE